MNMRYVPEMRGEITWYNRGPVRSAGEGLFRIVMGGKAVDISSYESILDAMPETSGFTYRKILHVDLERDRCTVRKSDPEGWQPGEGPLSGQMAQFALSGAIHPEDVERFITFTRMDHLRTAVAGRREALTMIYRRKTRDGFCWNLMEAIPARDGETRYVILCVKDVDSVFREGLEREGLAAQRRTLLQNLEDRAYIISSLSSLFFSTYYMNLEQDTFRTVTQQGRVGDVLGDEVNCTAAMVIYANHFIHPDDRAEYLSTMSMDHLRGSLRWWQPSVAVEYRRMSDNPSAGPDGWSWVRASVVLARTGENDLPKTAVYVAQYISGGKRGDCPGCR